ncbi:MAG: cyclic nucleotide-binding domain-containing protein [Deltaproteobacteria bacterium]|nr:cyclic nucleotide-binding domain-containing protein [Deltaproteobacteria bacterium]
MQEETLLSLKTHWNELLKQGQPLSFRKGQVLFYEGHIPYGLFIVQSGKVRYTRESGSCRAEHHVSSSEGEVLGLSHFFEENPYCCTCTASQNCQVVFISKSQLLPYC